MSGTGQPQQVDGSDRIRWSVWDVLFAILVGVLLLGGLGIVAFLSRYGDPAPNSYLRIENRTGTTVIVTIDVPMGGGPDHPTTKRVRVGEAAPGEVIPLIGGCDLQTLVARDLRGHVIATHEPTRLCDEVPTWAIS
jgi:hypothetical protein